MKNNPLKALASFWRKGKLAKFVVIIGALLVLGVISSIVGGDAEEAEETYDWPDAELAQMIPEPEGKLESISVQSDKALSARVIIDDTDYPKAYIKSCEEAGFNIDAESSSFDNNYDYKASNEAGYQLDISNVDETMYINLKLLEDEESTEADTSNDSSNSGGVSSDLKETMDAYEAFMDEYIEFMEEYSDSDTTSTEMMAEYADIMGKYTEFSTKVEKLDEDNMSEADYAYYMEVMNRVNNKLLNANY